MIGADLSHLDALQARLSHETARLERACTEPEYQLRSAWIFQIEREIESEYRRLGIEPADCAEMTDDELLVALS